MEWSLDDEPFQIYEKREKLDQPGIFLRLSSGGLGKLSPGGEEG
jgi:hypothetical protein